MNKRFFKRNLSVGIAGLLSVCAATGITAFANQGWVSENDNWYYYDNNGEMVYNEWKASGDHYFYLGSDGVMLRDELIYGDDGNYYYVDENGAMVSNRWVSVDDEEVAYDSESGYVWYYFGNNGKAYKNSSSSSGISKYTINGKTYVFDEEGQMLWGWIDEDGYMLNDQEDPFIDASYYLGSWEDGSMVTSSWLEYSDVLYSESNVDGVNYGDYESIWLWIDSSGKILKAEDDEVVIKSIGNIKYAFDQNGVMLSNWIDTVSYNTASSSSASDFRYFSDSMDGHLQKNTWIWATPSEDICAEDYYDDNCRWFYAGSTGSIYKNAIKSINNKKYVFDENGIMKTGFVIMNDETGFTSQFGGYDIEAGDFFAGGQIAELLSVEGNHLYYFGEDEENDGAMKTGKTITIELADDTYTFGFKTTGKSYGENGVEESSDKYYQNGLLLKASSDYKYGVVQTEDYRYVVVGTSGSEVTGSNKYIKDLDDNYLIIINNEYYNYVEGLDHSPVYYDGNYYVYDSEQEGNRGELIEKDETVSNLPEEMMLNF